jgi:hypothetical protein
MDWMTNRFGDPSTSTSTRPSPTPTISLAIMSIGRKHHDRPATCASLSDSNNIDTSNDIEA